MLRKALSIVALAGLILMLLPASSSATTGEISVTVVNANESFDPGWQKPGDPLYFLDQWWDSIRAAIWGLNETMDVLDEKIGEFQVTNESVALETYNDFADGLDEDLQDKGNTTRERVKVKLQTHIAVLERVRAQVPDEAKQAINTTIEKSQTCIDKIDNLPIP